MPCSMCLCASHLNLTLQHVNIALYELNRDPRMKCYPGFSRNELSDILLRARRLLGEHDENQNAWLEYKRGKTAAF